MKLLKDTKLYSIFTGTCPVCHVGDLYVEKNPFKLNKVLQMHDHCSHCGFKFKIETSFFFGAMYVSYAVGVAISVAVFIIAHFFLGLNVNATFIAIVIALVITFPYILRLSRNIWLNLFVKYDKEARLRGKKNHR